MEQLKIDEKSLIILKAIHENPVESISRIIRILAYLLEIPISTLWYHAKKLEKMGLIKVKKGRKCEITKVGLNILKLFS